MNMFLHELKTYMRSAVIWAFSMAALAVMYILIFNSMSEDIRAFQDILRNMPEAVRKALSIYVEGIANFVGFFSMVYVYIALCAAIQAMNLGTSIVSKEVREKTAEFLLTRPVSRQAILTAKLLAALAGLTVTNAIYLAVTVPMSLTVKSAFSMKIFLMISVTIFFIQLIFLALGVLTAVTIGKIKSVISISLTTVFGFFIIGALGSVIGGRAIRYFSPFQYFNPVYIIRNAAYETSFIVTGLIFVAAAVAASYLIFVRKDVHIA